MPLPQNCYARSLEEIEMMLDPRIFRFRVIGTLASKHFRHQLPDGRSCWLINRKEVSVSHLQRNVYAEEENGALHNKGPKSFSGLKAPAAKAVLAGHCFKGYSLPAIFSGRL